MKTPGGICIMSHTIYEKKGHVKVNYKPETKVMYVIWKDLFDQEIVRDCCERQLEQVQTGAKILIVDITNSEGVVLESTQKWFETYLFPKYARSGLRVIITIDAKSPVTQLSSKKWAHTGSKFSFDMVSVTSLKEAAKVAETYLQT